MQLPTFKDARYFQLAFQSVFLAYGIAYLHWAAEWWLYSIYFITCIITQLCCEMLFRKARVLSFDKVLISRLRNGIPSALISAFGLSLLLKTNQWQIAMLAAMVAILSKYLFRINGKHIFNPSALGIVVAILTGNAWISTGQWGSDTIIFFGVVCLGCIVVTKVQQLDLSLSFLGTFALLMFCRQVIFLGWPLDHFVQSLSTGSLLLFSFFMITDPRTTPNHPGARIGWAVCVAIFSFYLASFQFVQGAPIWVLVSAQPLVPLLDKLFKRRVFRWRSSSIKYAEDELTVLSTKQVFSL